MTPLVSLISSVQKPPPGLQPAAGAAPAAAGTWGCAAGREGFQPHPADLQPHRCQWDMPRYDLWGWGRLWGPRGRGDAPFLAQFSSAGGLYGASRHPAGSACVCSHPGELLAGRAATGTSGAEFHLQAAHPTSRRCPPSPSDTASRCFLPKATARLRPRFAWPPAPGCWGCPGLWLPLSPLLFFCRKMSQEACGGAMLALLTFSLSLAAGE